MKFAVYCSDVSGAFDKVSRRRLTLKLKAKGLDDAIVRVLISWLRDRVARIVVSGKHSKDQVLSNMVFQGTVLGPGLWNIMYEDARHAIASNDFIEIVFADDLNAFRAFATGVPNSIPAGSRASLPVESPRMGSMQPSAV